MSSLKTNLLYLLMISALSGCGGGGGGGASPNLNVILPGPPPSQDAQPVPANSPNFTDLPLGLRPVLYVLVNFSDWTTELSSSVHYDRMYYSDFGVQDYYDRLFKQRISIVPASESYGNANDGIVRLTIDSPHPNDPKKQSEMVSLLLSSGNILAQYVDAKALDADNDGVLRVDELNIIFVVAGRSSCSSCVDNPLPQVRAFARKGDALVISGVDVPQFAVAPERGTYTSLGINDNVALVEVVHELGHSVFGASDHYGEEDNGSFKSYLDGWCVMDTSGYFRNADGFYGPQNMAGYTKLETNIVRALEIEETGSIAITAAARSVVNDAREDTGIARIWLDPYKLRESLVLEYRDSTGYDSFLPSEGAITTRVQSLADGGSSQPASYRRAALVEGTGERGALSIGNGGTVAQKVSTPGMAERPGDTSPSVYLYYKGVSGDTAGYDVQIEDFGPRRGHLRYDEVPSDEINGHSYLRYYGYDGQSSAYGGTIFVNDTEFNMIDGMEIRVRDKSTVKIEVYAGILDDGTPYDLLSNQSFSLSNAGWNRVFFSNPVRFPQDQSRFVAVEIETPSIDQFVYPRSYNSGRTAHEVQTYASSDGISYLLRSDSRIAHLLLMSSQE
jgi:M6 family metalloprotease-like protein